MHNIPFDGLATYFIFLIGVPALVIQGMPGELRRVLTSSRRRMWSMVLFTGSWVFGAILVAIFCIGLLQQCPLPDEQQVMCPLPFLPSKIPQDWIMIGLLGMLTLITALSSIFVIRRYSRRTTMVSALRREVERDLHATGYLKPRALNDLIELGQHSRGGQDKEYVLKALRLLVDKTTASGKYSGDSLEGVALGLVKVIATDPYVGSSENYEQASEILLEIVKANPGNDGGAHTPDVHHCAEVLGALGKSSLRELEKHLSGDRVAIGFVQALGRTARKQAVYVNLVSESLREIGIEAVDKDKMLVAMRVFNELTALLAQDNHAHPELEHDTISLMAHFWECGTTTQEFVRMRLDKLLSDLNGTVPQIMHAAHSHAARTGHFVTADRITEMASEMQGAS